MMTEATTQAMSADDVTTAGQMIQSRNRAAPILDQVLDTTENADDQWTSETEMTSDVEQTTVSDSAEYFNDMISNSASFQRSIPPRYVYPKAFDPGYHFVNVTGTCNGQLWPVFALYLTYYSQTRESIVTDCRSVSEYINNCVDGFFAGCSALSCLLSSLSSLLFPLSF